MRFVTAVLVAALCMMSPTSVCAQDVVDKTDKTSIPMIVRTYSDSECTTETRMGLVPSNHPCWQVQSERDFTKTFYFGSKLVGNKVTITEYTNDTCATAVVTTTGNATVYKDLAVRSCVKDALGLASGITFDWAPDVAMSGAYVYKSSTRGICDDKAATMTPFPNDAAVYKLDECRKTADKTSEKDTTKTIGGALHVVYCNYESADCTGVCTGRNMADDGHPLNTCRFVSGTGTPMVYTQHYSVIFGKGAPTAPTPTPTPSTPTKPATTTLPPSGGADTTATTSLASVLVALVVAFAARV